MRGEIRMKKWIRRNLDVIVAVSILMTCLIILIFVIDVNKKELECLVHYDEEPNVIYGVSRYWEINGRVTLTLTNGEKVIIDLDEARVFCEIVEE